MKDSFRHKGLRKKLVAEIKNKGIADKRILDAINKIPRHYFLDSAFTEIAYEDKAFPIGAEQTISQPYTVAYQTMLLEIEENEKVLEIGTGSGYQSCILLELGAEVYTIERQRILYEKAKIFFPKLGYYPKSFFGDGSQGLSTFAPFDKILVTAGAPTIPDVLKSQLKIGGIMVIPVGDEKLQVMVRVIKTADSKFNYEYFDTFKFVPLLGEKAW